MSEDATPNESGRLLAEWTLSRSVAFQWLVASTVGFVLSLYLFAAVLEALHGGSLEPVSVSVSSPDELLVWLAVALSVLVAVIVPHELVHGLFMARYGARPEYGVGVAYFVLPYAYARTEGASYTRNQMLVILLAPLAVLSLGGLIVLALVPSPLLILALAANAAGSVGDLWMAVLLCRYPADVRVGDLPGAGKNGIGIYGTSSHRTGVGYRLAASAWKGAGATFAAILAGLFALVVGSLAFASGNVVIGDPNGRWFLFRHELVADDRGALLEVGFPALLVLSVAGGILWACLSAAFRRLG